MNFRSLYLLGKHAHRERVVLTAFVDGIEPQAWKVYDGERFGKEFPGDATIALEPQSPGIQLTTYLSNTENMLVVGRDVRALIEKFCKGVEVEVLPFTLLDHRKRVFSKDYSIINPIGTFDCLDLKASDIDWDPDQPREMLGINKRVLDHNRCKDAPALFRLHRDAGTYVFRSDLAEAIDALKPTNFVWKPFAFAD